MWTWPKMARSFLKFANSFHPTIKFNCEKSSTDTIFLDTKVYKGSRFPTTNTLDVQTYFKPTETFQYTNALLILKRMTRCAYDKDHVITFTALI